MKEFRSIEDVEAAGLSCDISAVVRSTLTDLMEACAVCGEKYNPESDGYAVLVEPGDTDDAIRTSLGGHTLKDALFEGCIHTGACFLTCVLFNNQFGVSIVIPDQPWLDPAVRARLEDNL